MSKDDNSKSFLHAGYSRKITLPINLDSKNQNFSIFKEVSLQSSPDIFVHNLKNIVIDDTAIVYKKNGQIKTDLYEPSERQKYDLFQKKNKLNVQNLVHPRLFIQNLLNKFTFKTSVTLDRDKSYLVVTDDRAINNIYHWFCDSMVKLIAYGKLNEDEIIVLPEDCWKKGFVRDSLSIFGITEKEIYVLKKNNFYHLGNAKFISNSIFTPSSSNGFILSKLREEFYKSFDQVNSDEPVKKVYLSRGKALNRNISNLSDFENFIVEYGFHEIIAEDYSLFDLIHILIDTKYLIGVVGANLTHMLFMRKDTYVIELIHSDFVIPSNKIWPGMYDDKFYGFHFLYLANSLSINYLYFPCKTISKDANYHSDVISQDLHVNLNDLKKELDLII
jgi:hypothetical protein